MFRSAIFYSLLLSGLMATTAMATPTVVNVGTIGDSSTPLFQCNFLNAGDTDPDGTQSVKDWDEQAIAATVRSLQTWDKLINDDPGRTLNVCFSWENLGEHILGGASSPHYYQRTSDEYQLVHTLVENVWKNKSTTYYAGVYDIYVVLNPTTNFYYGETPMSGVYTGALDYQTVLTHEIGHTVGFTSYSTPVDGYVTFEADDHGQIIYTKLDSLMTNKDGVKLIDEENGVNAIKLNDTIALEGSELTIFNPDPWEPGSSLSHIDIEKLGGQASDILMRKVLSNDISVRTLSYEEMLLMDAMGWDMNFAAIPEPATASLSLLGLAAMAMRRRRK